MWPPDRMANSHEPSEVLVVSDPITAETSPVVRGEIKHRGWMIDACRANYDDRIALYAAVPGSDTFSVPKRDTKASQRRRLVLAVIFGGVWKETDGAVRLIC